VLHLPLWATDWLKRHEAELAGAGRPLVLHEPQKGALRLAALDRNALARGLFLGQNLADARAMVPELVMRPLDRPLLIAAFADFADWHSNASPLVAVMDHAGPYGDLVLDITGVAHLFGGEAGMLERLTGRLRGVGYGVSGAIAATMGAAWALARHEPGTVLQGPPQAALAGLPVSALRLEERQVWGLQQMGLKHIGQLYGRDRKGLVARFGASLTTRLDQALGFLAERMTPRLPQVDYFAERRFAEPIGLMDDVLACTADLAVTLAQTLQTAGVGAQAFHLFLYRVDHKVLTLSVNAARATRDAGHIARLFSNRAERLEGEYDPGFGIDAIRLAASSTSVLDPAQLGALDGDGAEELNRLYDRLTSRLGPLAVTRTRFVDTHIPERAVRLEPVIAAGPPDPRAAPDPELLRPVRLLPAPEPITVLAQVPDAPPAAMVWRRVRYKFVKAAGPERIGAEWWRSRSLPILTQATLDIAQKEGGLYFDMAGTTRDYYVAEDDGGRRFWLFRLGLFEGGAEPAWYLHGVFS